MAEKYKLEFTAFLEFDQFQIYIEKTCLLNGILLLIIIEMWRIRDTTVSNTFIAPTTDSKQFSKQLKSLLLHEIHIGGPKAFFDVALWK